MSAEFSVGDDRATVFGNDVWDEEFEFRIDFDDGAVLVNGAEIGRYEAHERQRVEIDLRPDHVTIQIYDATGARVGSTTLACERRIECVEIRAAVVHRFDVSS